MPTYSSVYEFGADYVLVLERDEMGIERVLELALASPSEG
jgi:hypothetical protein